MLVGWRRVPPRLYEQAVRRPVLTQRALKVADHLCVVDERAEAVRDSTIWYRLRGGVRNGVMAKNTEIGWGLVAERDVAAGLAPGVPTRPLVQPVAVQDLSLIHI